MPFGVYVHFPWCLSKCPYCDFASQVSSSIPHRRYGRAIERELAMREGALDGRVARSLYLGGGTPSLWEPAAAAATLDVLRTKVAFSTGAERTLEANPGAADLRRLESFRRAGLNRLSLGIQSFDTKTLLLLGRRHTGEEAERAAHEAVAAGFDNLTLDLIYGAPGQSVALAREDATRAAALQPKHLSVYALTLEHLAVPVPMAAWVKEGRIQVPDDEAQWEMGRAAREELVARGFARYEISNHALPGFESRHNSLYWTGGEYLGLGPGASGFSLNEPTDPSQGGRRWSNHRSAKKWFDAIDAGELPEESSEALTGADLLRERLVMGLRLVVGVDIGAACRELGGDTEALLESARALERRGLAVVDGERVRLSEKGLDFHSEAALAFV